MATTGRKYAIGKGEHYPPTGNFIHYHIVKNNIKKADVAKALDIAPGGLTDYFKRDTLQLAVVWKLSLALKHNFLAELGEYLPHRFETMREKALLKELAEKNEQLREMEIKLSVYEKVVSGK